MAAIVSEQGLKPATRKQMAAVQSRVDEVGPNTVAKTPTGRQAASLAWGLGWGLAQDGDGWLLWHWGDNGNTKAFVVLSPARREGVVLFANSRKGLSIVEAALEGAWTAPIAPALKWLDVTPYARD
jgi:CubicO group peptidase (beta-lactamase class C family)